MLKTLSKYYRFVKFLKRAYSDYDHYSSHKESAQKNISTTKAIENPTLEKTIGIFTDLEVGVIYRSDFKLRLVVKNYNAPQLFGLLASALPDAVYYLDQKKIDPSSLLDCPLSFESQKLRCSYQDEHTSFDIFVESYFKQSLTGKWHCKTKNNPYARVISDSFWNNTDHLRKKITSSSENLKRRVGDIDVVYTWANVHDKDWMEKRTQHASEADITKAAAACTTRINNNSELKYSIRSAKKHMPWIRHIYIVSTGSPPDWLNLDHDSSIHWITHSDIIPDQYLPTFNSHVIESCLHKIPGLSKFFVYLNDDIMITKPMELSYFFDVNGQTISKMEDYGMVNGEPDESDPDYLNASRNSADILYQDYHYYPTQLHEHCPQIFSKDILSEIEANNRKYIDGFRTNKFRNITDLNLTSFFYHHYAYITKRGIYGYSQNNKLIKSSSPKWRADMATFLDSANAFQSLCLNEGGEKEADWASAVNEFLDQLFPQKGAWEK